MLTIDEQAQAMCDRLHAGARGPRWRVQLGGWPCVVLPALNRGHAIGRYYNLMGITASSFEPAVEQVEAEPAMELAEAPFEAAAALAELDREAEPTAADIIVDVPESER